MNLTIRWGVVCLAAVLLSSCSLFRRDLKDASDSAQVGETSVVEERVAGGGPTAGETGLERASEQTFEWSEENKAAPSPPSPASNPSTLPPRIEDTPSGGGLESALASPLTPKRVPLETELPGAAPVPPEPTGKPVAPSALSGVAGFGQPPMTVDSQEDPRAAIASRPPRPDSLIGSNPMLPSNGVGEPPLESGPRPVGGLSLRSPPALATSPSEPRMADSGVPKGASLFPSNDSGEKSESASGDLSRAVRSSGLSLNRSDPWHGPSKAVPEGAGPSAQSMPPPQMVSAPATGLETNSSRFVASNAKADPNPSGAFQPPSEKSAPAPVSRPTSEPLPDAKTLKAQGVQQYRDKEFEAAILTFRKYLSAYPDEDQEVRWRLANSLLLSKRWGEASKEFNVLRGSQRTEFVADAILKLGKIDQIKGDLPGAKLNWKRVVEKYPNTEAAEEAAKLLAENP